MESRRQAGEGATGRGARAARRRRRPPNFIRPETVSRRECRKSGSLAWPRPASPRCPGQGRPPTPSPARPPTLLPPVSTRGPQAQPAASLPGHSETPPPRCPGTLAPNPGDPLPSPSSRRGVRRPGGHGGRSREGGPAGREEGAARTEFPTFSPGPDVAGADGTSRALPPSPASWSHAPGWGLPREAGRGRAGRAARTGRGQEGRQGAGGGGSGGAAVAAGKNC